MATTCADYANPRCGKLDGTAAYYDRGVMQQVLRNRGITPRADVNGYAAVTDCSLIGKVAVAEIMGGAPERFLIADCSATQDLATQISRRQVIEVDWETAVRHGLNKVGLQRNGISDDVQRELKRAYRLFFKSDLNLSQARERAEGELQRYPEVEEFLSFLDRSDRGLVI